MLKKMLKNASALLLSLSLLMPIQLLCTNAQETDPLDKICVTLRECLDDSDDYINVRVTTVSGCDDNEILNEAGLSDDRVIQYGWLAVWAKSDEIIKMAANDNVVGIEFAYYDQITGTYTVEDSCKALRLALRTEPADSDDYFRWREDPPYDVNQDGNITVFDACTILEYSVQGVELGPCEFAEIRLERILEKDALN